ncbi:MAG: hypothetical protein K2Y18_07045 [Alphaproteobacteria bacterium]|nr:hypothetical protein [Alphaproteobacteria bacterium]
MKSISLKTACFFLCCSIIGMPCFAMNSDTPDSSVGQQNSRTKFQRDDGQRMTAPFSENDVLTQAEKRPTNFPYITYLRSPEGLEEMKNLIEQINQNGIAPEPYGIEYAANVSWDRNIPGHYSNKVTIARVVDKRYSSSHAKVL